MGDMPLVVHGYVLKNKCTIYIAKCNQETRNT